jgi:hypothetical protein
MRVQTFIAANLKNNVFPLPHYNISGVEEVQGRQRNSGDVNFGHHGLRLSNSFDLFKVDLSLFILP